MRPNPLQAATMAHLTPSERNELAGFVDAIGLVAREDYAVGDETMHRSDLLAAINMLSPNVARAVSTLYTAADGAGTGGRAHLFQPLMTPNDFADELGVDRKALNLFGQTVRQHEIQDELIAKMDPTRASATPPAQDRREDIARALTADEGPTFMREYGDAAIAQAGAESGLSLRDTISTVMDVKEKHQ
jgi:hypothetical protein